MSKEDHEKEEREWEDIKETVLARILASPKYAAAISAGAEKSLRQAALRKPKKK